MEDTVKTELEERQKAMFEELIQRQKENARLDGEAAASNAPTTTATSTATEPAATVTVVKPTNSDTTTTATTSNATAPASKITTTNVASAIADVKQLSLIHI